MLWELEPRVLDKCAMRLQAYGLRPTGHQLACQQALRAKQLLTRSILICDAGKNLEIRIFNLESRVELPCVQQGDQRHYHRFSSRVTLRPRSQPRPQIFESSYLTAADFRVELPYSGSRSPGRRFSSRVTLQQRPRRRPRIFESA